MGGKSSSTAQQNTSQYYDNRSVVDAGGGIVGTGNAWDQSLNLTDAHTSDNSFHLTDAHTSNTQTNLNVTDGGAFGLVGKVADGLTGIGLAQVEASKSIAANGNNLGTGALDLAVKATEGATGFNTAALGKVFDLSASSQAYGWKAVSDVLGMAKDVTTEAGKQASQAAGVAQAAYQGAADTANGNKTIIYVALAVVAAVGLAVAFKR